MPCYTFRTADGASGFICTGRQKPKKCTGCGKKTATLLCDYQAGDGKTCDKSICKACSRHVGHDRDYCLSHPVEGR